MSKAMLSYPDGVAGAALLLMRLSAALAAWAVFSQLPDTFEYWASGIASSLVAAALIAGLFTRLAAVLLVAAIIAFIIWGAGGALFFSLSGAGATSALVLMGPGAFSIDAQRHGRRVITLTPHSPDWGGRD